MNAPASRTYEHCKEWAAQGHEVTVITCVPNFPQGKIYSGYKNRVTQTEQMDGIRVIRVWSWVAFNRGTLIRILDFLSYAIMAFWRGLFLRTDVIIATSPQFFTAVSGYLLSLCKRRPWIFEVRDLWPESILAVGAIQAKYLIAGLEKVELFLYRRAKRIVVVSGSFKSDMVRRSIDPEKIQVIRNGIDISQVQVSSSSVALRARFDIAHTHTVVGYFGTIGMAHGLDFILRSIEGIDDVTLIIIGEGAAKRDLIQLKEELALQHVIILDAVPKKDIYSYISMIDVALINLKKSDAFKKVIPSKIFENAAMQKPILLGLAGEAKSIIEFYQAGIAFHPEDEQDFKCQISRLIQNRNLYSICQVGGQRLANDHDRKKLAHDMLDTIIEAVEEK